MPHTQPVLRHTQIFEPESAFLPQAGALCLDCCFLSAHMPHFDVLRAPPKALIFFIAPSFYLISVTRTNFPIKVSTTYLIKKKAPCQYFVGYILSRRYQISLNKKERRKIWIIQGWARSRLEWARWYHSCTFQAATTSGSAFGLLRPKARSPRRVLGCF